MTMKDFMAGHQAASITNTRGAVVRRLIVDGEMLTIDAITDIVSVKLDAEITYEPGVMDFGSLLFKLNGRNAKLATECDKITFDDGSVSYVCYPGNAQS